MIISTLSLAILAVVVRANESEIGSKPSPSINPAVGISAGDTSTKTTSSTIQSSTARSGNFVGAFDDPLPSFSLNTTTQVVYSVNGTSPNAAKATILLCKAVPKDISQNSKTFEFQNADLYKIFEVQPNFCISGTIEKCSEGRQARSSKLSFTITPTQQGKPLDLNNYFFCFVDTSFPDHCMYYSHHSFNIAREPNGFGTEGFFLPPTTAIALPVLDPTSIDLVFTTQITDAPTAATTETPTTILSTVTNPSSTVATTTVTPLAGLQESSKSNGSLSNGAKVGIALGALFIFGLLLLAALFFLRRKHAKRNPPAEQVMLTRSMHTDSFSRNLMSEKEDHTISTSPTTHVHETHHENNGGLGANIALPIQRHSALSPYEPVPSAPYTGAAAAVPRRKPTSATMASTVSRGISTNSRSTSGALSPRSAAGTSTFEEYHDVPIYGDARHSPQVFAGRAPFLEEEGMSAEEVARLEEEERRIDAAIAEADRRR